MENSFDIFLSLPGGDPDDRRNVRNLRVLLNRYSVRTWSAEQNLSPQEEYSADSILPVLMAAPVAIVCLGSSPRSPWGREELAEIGSRARSERDFLLLTVLLPGSDPPDSLGKIPPTIREAPTFDLRGGVNSVAPLVPYIWQRLFPGRRLLFDEIVRTLRTDSMSAVLTGGAGVGKSALASVVAAELSADYPDGEVWIPVQAGEGVEVIIDRTLRELRLNDGFLSGRQEESLQERLAGGRHLLVFDDVNLDSATELVPPSPSAALILSRRNPRVDQEHAVFEVRPPGDEGDSPTPIVVRKQHQPGYASDVPSGADLLAIDEPVAALCSVIAAKDVEPPLSIGLFGEWGAGKTFFIAKMRERIEALGDASALADRSAYCSSIKQVVFNAWHYADANLWASLAGHVFEGLAGETETDHLYGQLESSQMQLRDARADEKIAQARAGQAEREERTAQNALDEAKVELNDLASAAVDVLDGMQDPDPFLRDLRTALHDDDDLTIELAKRLLTPWGAIRQLWRQAKTTLVLLAGAAAVALVVAVRFPNRIAIGVALLPVLAMSIRVVGWPLRWIGRARSKARARVDALQREQTIKLQNRLGQLRRDEAEARQRQEEARREIAAAEREIAEIKDGRRLFSFIAERSAKGAYGPYLGVVALVRRDFEHLAHLIDSHTQRSRSANPPLERIVLYIDDLDRCPSERVVEVLEAVHLLMASQLFVVVVAVDPRWLLSSLQRHYASQITAGDDGRWTPTPEGYLEKIFQIPFSLPAMEDDGFRRLIENLIPVAEEDDSDLATAEVVAADGGGVGRLGADEIPPLSFLEPKAAPQSEQLDLEPQALRVTSGEIEFLSQLGCMVRTPRGAKRLANLYRLLRASLSSAQLHDLLGEGGGDPEFPCVQTLLSIVVGFPAISSELLSQVVREGGGSWWSFTEEWAPPEEHEPDWQRLLSAAASLQSLPIPGLDAFARWVPRVSSYSYGHLRTMGIEPALPQ